MARNDLVPMHEHLAGLLPMADLHSAKGQFSISSLEIESPIEIDVVTRPDGRLVLQSSPPLYYIETTLANSLHSMTITIVAEPA